jgi:signal transduction histidine kinase
VILRFAGIASQIPDEDARREELNSALARADLCLIEGREAIKAMRTSPTHLKELAGALEEVAVDLNFLSNAKVEIRADLQPPYDCGYDVDEILHIGREALRNALQHARATLIQVKLTCTQNQFELLVTDDGIGIPEKLVSGDKVLGHWGIPGMRERAERIGGTLRYSLRQEGGSEVRLLLPNPQGELHIFKRWWKFLRSISSRGSHLS